MDSEIIIPIMARFSEEGWARFFSPEFMRIRRARASDLEAIHILLNQLLLDCLERRKPMWEKLLRTEGYVAWVAEVKDEPVGFLDLFIWPDVAHGGNVGLIGNLVIDERFRRQGIGAHLVREAIEYSKVQKLVELHLWTDFDNEAAIALYKKRGFHERALLLELPLSERP